MSNEGDRPVPDSRSAWSPPKNIVFRRQEHHYDSYQVPYPTIPSFDSPIANRGYDYGGYHLHPSVVPYPYDFYQPPPWAAPPVKYIVDIQPNDVLCGRGGATNSHSGNKTFRQLVKDFQPRYLKAKKRDKPSVAEEIVALIREKGGRFLRRRGTSPPGDVLWADIGDDAAREKTCQALREKAPALRRQMLSEAGNRESGESTQELTSSSHEHSSLSDGSPRPRMWTSRGFSPRLMDSPGDDLIMIRPDARLMGTLASCEPISVDSLSPQARAVYLTDFLPPLATNKRRKVDGNSNYP